MLELLPSSGLVATTLKFLGLKNYYTKNYYYDSDYRSTIQKNWEREALASLPSSGSEAQLGESGRQTGRSRGGVLCPTGTRGVLDESEEGASLHRIGKIDAVVGQRLGERSDRDEDRELRLDVSRRLNIGTNVGPEPSHVPDERGDGVVEFDWRCSEWLQPRGRTVVTDVEIVTLVGHGNSFVGNCAAICYVTLTFLGLKT